MPTAPTSLPAHIAPRRAPGPSYRLDGALVPVEPGCVRGKIAGGRLDN
jgi:hypothetical protein